jgi:hypothetical protein
VYPFRRGAGIGRRPTSVELRRVGSASRHAKDWRSDMMHRTYGPANHDPSSAIRNRPVVSFYRRPAASAAISPYEIGNLPTLSRNISKPKNTFLHRSKCGSSADLSARTRLLILGTGRLPWDSKRAAIARARSRSGLPVAQSRMCSTKPSRKNPAAVRKAYGKFGTAAIVAVNASVMSLTVKRVR